MASFEATRAAMLAAEEGLFENANLAYTSVVDNPDQDNDFIVEAGTLEDEETKMFGEADADIQSLTVPDALPIPPDFISTFEAQDGDTEVRVRKIVSGPIDTSVFNGRVRPANGGNSIGNPRLGGAGTLGIVYSQDKYLFLMSNWHVLYNGVGANGDPIIQPGSLDGGRLPADQIGNNHIGVLDIYRDLAIGRALAGQVASGTRCYGAVKGLAQASNKMVVKKCGRTTRATTGSVVSTSATVNVGGYPGGTRRFRDQLQLTPMSRPGDSGSVIIDSDKDMIVGLLFAGGSTATFANKIERIFNLGVDFADGEMMDDLIDPDGLNFDF